MKALKLSSLSALVLAASVAGCAQPQPKYEWANYETSLYSNYKTAGDPDALAKGLGEVIAKGEQAGRVPPGVYAELGYVFLSQGKTKDAVTYFEREKARWPESAIFMDRMIAVAKKAGPKVAGNEQVKAGEVSK